MGPWTSRRLAALPLLLGLALAGLGALPQVRANPVLLRTFLVTAGLVVAWAVLLLGVMAAQGREPVFSVALLKQHYLQACVHTSILLYWGWYWRPVYDHAPLIFAQLVFAYAFDMLLQLSRRGKYTLGFGPFPVIFSINLFLWFKDDWFYLQFLLIAVGFAAKEFLHWTREGRSTHIFNPSSFPLAIFSWGLWFTHGFHLTWGQLIAGTQFLPFHIFLFIFLVSLPGQFFFGVTTMTLSAVVTMYLWDLIYLAATGTYFFRFIDIPIAIFLAMNLLFTDPATSPRSELGRIFYGILYAGTVVVLEVVTGGSFASKLLLVPMLNLAVQVIDRAARSPALRRIDPARIGPEVTGRRRNLSYMAIWALVFGLLSYTRSLGDDHPGQQIPFWQAACRKGSQRACKWVGYAESVGCQFSSGWACNELAVEHHQRQDDSGGLSLVMKACRLGFQPGCENASRIATGAEIESAAPTVADYPMLLSIWKPPRIDVLRALPPAQVRAEACRDGWTSACQRQ